MRAKRLRLPLLASLCVALDSGSLLAAPKPTPTPDIPSRIHAYEAAHPGVHRVGGRVSEPRELSRVKPEYPEEARRQRISLRPIMVIAVISDTGVVVDPVLVSSASPELDAAFMKAVRQWRYEPALLNGKPVPAFLTITLTWHF